MTLKIPDRADELKLHLQAFRDLRREIVEAMGGNVEGERTPDTIRRVRADRDEAVELLSLLWGRRMAGEEPADWVNDGGRETDLCRRVAAVLRRNGYDVGGA